MPAILEQQVLEDELAVSLARAVAAANERARQEGIDLKESIVTVNEQSNESHPCWRINYGPRRYVGRRGGDLIIDVGIGDAQIKRVLRGQ